MHLISIIIPVYNVEQYLPQCLDSVFNQTYSNLEIILVNDGSTDRCPEICEAYAARDSRIKVIHKSNGGLSDARNAGIRVATGQYIAFLDSDDLLAPIFLKKLLHELTENDADIVECNFFSFEKDVDFNHNQTHNVKIYDTETALKLVMEGILGGVVWNKLYRKELAVKTLFPLNKINEDEFWTYKVFAKAERVVKISDTLYFYRQQPTSIMGSSYSLRRLDGVEAHEKRIQFIHKHFPALLPVAVRMFCISAMHHYRQLTSFKSLDSNKFYRNQLQSKVRKYSTQLNRGDGDWKAAFWRRLFLFSPTIYLRLWILNESRIEWFRKKISTQEKHLFSRHHPS